MSIYGNCMINRYVLDLNYQGQNICALNGKEVDINDSDSYCPVNLSNIPNYMGINLCSVKSVEWTRLKDGQLIDVVIKFIPEDKDTIQEASILEMVNDISSFQVVENPSKEFVEDHVKDMEILEDFFHDVMRNNTCMFLDKKNKVIAVFMVYPDKGHNILNDFEIAPKYRGKGLSYQFLDYAVKRKGADHLWVNEDNKVAIHVYEKYGFRFTGDKMSVFEIEDGKKARHTRLYMELK